MVWGSRRLATTFNKSLPTDDTYGEAWEISDHASHSSIVALGPHQGTPLRELMQSCPHELLGATASRHRVFPWLIKILDAADWLSVQVHPDDDKVQTLLPGEIGKTEAWFILAVEPESKVWAGLKPGVGESELRAALATGSVADCLHSFVPQPGDCLFLSAGTVHAVGGGVLMAEVQQTSDATFRLFDWNRKDAQGKSRQLHIEESMASIDWTRGPQAPVHVPFDGLPTGPKQTFPLVDCRYFRLEYIASSEPYNWGGTGRMQVAVVLRGSGTLQTPEGAYSLTTGQTWLIPATMPALTCRPEPGLSVLLSSLPD